jgi:hypothetical protein
MKTKQIILVAVLLSLSFGVISWGVTGHRTVGRIAERHLTPKAMAAVKELLGQESLADVSSWADEMRQKPENQYTFYWHFVNVPVGLTYDQFKTTIEGMAKANVYSALLEQEKALGDPGTPREKKIEALKFIVHFVGDLHQPMHVSRAEDQGGNTILLHYDGKETNLHSLWDSKLIESQGLNDKQMADKYDHARRGQIKRWQRAPLMQWLWESYTISSKLYSEVDAMNNKTVPDGYYDSHITIIQTRIEQAGIRLAGILNEIFKD